MDSLSAEQLLASFWLHREEDCDGEAAQQLERIAADMGFEVSQDTLNEAAQHLSAELSKGDVDQWVVLLCFAGHPHNIWNFMIDAMAEADSDEHLQIIATGFAEHLLAHYGSMISTFERWAAKDPRFKRMLTGVWRHRMSDAVWMRLRALQAEVPDPLPNMIPIENGVDYRADKMSEEDRLSDDKGFYVRDEDGSWQRSSGRK